MGYLQLLNLGLTFLQQYLSGIKNKLPAEVVSSIESSITALEAHRDDLITKANLEAQRG